MCEQNLNDKCNIRPCAYAFKRESVLLSRYTRITGMLPSFK